MKLLKTFQKETEPIDALKFHQMEEWLAEIGKEVNHSISRILQSDFNIDSNLEVYVAHGCLVTFETDKDG